MTKISSEKAHESVMREGEGREDMELIRATVRKIEQEEERLLGVRTAQHDRVIARMEDFAQCHRGRSASCF